MLTLTYFRAMSTWVAYAFEWVNLLKCQNLQKLANGQDIDYSEEKNFHRASSASLLGLFSITFTHVYWYIQHIAGERLQDNWSSGL